MKNIFQSHPLRIIIIISAIILFFCSSLRHFLFQSNALDLGWFDQAIYLISQGEIPIISFRGFHILGDHAAFILYPLALLYKIYPNIHWLFAVQSIALAITALPVWQLSRNAGLNANQSVTMAIVYLLYPLVFNINLFDFHPEVIAIPGILWAVLAAKIDNIWGFIIAIIVILSCKAVLSLTVAAMGFWLFIFQKKRLYGSIALATGITWFLLTTQVIIPYFSTQEAAAVSRYGFLGNSVLEILKNLFLNPGLILTRLLTFPNLEYLILLFLPIIWGLNPRHLTPLIAAIPTFMLNLLTDYQPQKDLTHQYSLPILPFLILVVINTLASGKGLLRHRRGIIIWTLITFFALAKFSYFGSQYLATLDTWVATREAITLVPSQGSLLTSPTIAPHLTQRSEIQLAIEGFEAKNMNKFDYILLNIRHPGWDNSQELVKNLVNQLQQNPNFKLRYQRDDVFLFEKFNES